MERNRTACMLAVAALALAGLPATAWSATVTVTEHSKAPLGAFLTSSNGRTLYMFTADRPGRSDCTGACASAWPPVLTTARPAARSGVNPGALGGIPRGSAHQVTYDGMPLYYFAGDRGAGSVAGEGIHSFGGAWYVVSPSGEPVLPNGRTASKG